MDFLLDLFRKAKARGMHTCIDTAGQPFTRREPFFGKFQALMEVTDLLLVDIKHIDADAHLKLTGCPNDNIRDMFCYLSAIHKPIWVRQVLVPGWTDAPDSLQRTRSFLDTLTMWSASRCCRITTWASINGTSSAFPISSAMCSRLRRKTCSRRGIS